MDERYDIAVVGGGGAGTMAYLRGALNGDRVALFAGDAESKRKGRATWVAEVDNIPGMHALKRPITQTSRSTFAWLDAQQAFAGQHRRIAAAVTGLEACPGGGFELRYGDQQRLRASYVINATGIMDVQPEIDGSILPFLPFANRYDLLYCVRCDGHKTIHRRLSVIGNEDVAIHLAVMMIDRYGHARVDVLSHGLGERFSGEARELAAAYGVELHAGAISEIVGDPRGAGLEGFTLSCGTRINSDMSIVALGIIPYNELLVQAGARVDENGRAVVDGRYETNVSGLFVVGDLVSGRKMQIYTAWDEAVDAADEINARLRRAKRARRLSELRAEGD